MRLCEPLFRYALIMWIVAVVVAPFSTAHLWATSTDKKETPKKKAKQGPQLSGTEKGVFKIVVDGEEKGTEEFEIAPVGNQFVAKGKIRLTVTRDDKPTQFLIESDLLMQSDYDPVRYTMVQKSDGNTSTAKMEFDRGTANAEFNTGSGSEKRQYQFEPGVALLDDNVFHHYVLLARRYNYEKGGLQELYAFIPQESIGGILRMNYKGDEKIEINGKSTEVQHLIVDTNDLKLDLYLEGPEHRLVKLEVPSSNVVVLRQS
jgi:hypothetical protein